MPSFQELFLAKMQQQSYRTQLLQGGPAKELQHTTQTKAALITQGPFKGQNPEHVERMTRVLGELMTQHMEAEFHRAVNVEVPDRSKRDMEFRVLNPIIRLWTP